MAIGTFPGMLQEGDHASRPAATAVGSGALYACSTHALIYQSDGATWSTWATLGGGAPAAHAASHESGGSDEIDVTGLTGAGGGGVGWNQDANESGASFANFTANSGTWASSGTVITQTDAGAAHKRARYNTKLPIALPLIVEVEVKITSGGGWAGMNVGYDGAAGTGGTTVAIDDANNRAYVETSAVAGRDTSMTVTIATNTFYKLRAIFNGQFVSIYVAGTLLGTACFSDAGGNSDPQAFIGLVTWTAAAEFRNFKVWTLSTGLPA